MARLTFPNVYDFYYKLSKDERKALIGRVFQEDGHDLLYFPVQLAKGEFNYGKQQGLIFVTKIRKHYHTHEKYFTIGAFSPDDLDLILRLDETHLRQEVITHLKGMAKNNVTYRGVLLNIQKHFNTGTIYE